MTARDLRLVFAGTPPFAAVHLRHLLDENFTVVGAYSQPDRPSGRGKKILPSPVKALAQEHNLPVEQPLNFDAANLTTLRDYRPDVLVVVAYGLLLPPEVLALPRYGCINVHASLLPRWRGAAPIERAILAGDAETGVSIMQMDAGLDTGPVLARATTPIRADDNSATLTARLASLGCTNLSAVLAQASAGTLQPEPQDEARSCYARKLRKEEAGIDWSQPAMQIHNQLRAFYPRSPAWCHYHAQRLRLIRGEPRPGNATAPPGTLVAIEADAVVVACGKDRLAIQEIQLEGRKPMPLAALRNGHPDYFTVGAVLESAETHGT